jgi:hypothetical protein
VKREEKQDRNSCTYIKVRAGFVSQAFSSDASNDARSSGSVQWVSVVGQHYDVAVGQCHDTNSVNIRNGDAAKIGQKPFQLVALTQESKAEGERREVGRPETLIYRKDYVPGSASGPMPRP